MCLWEGEREKASERVSRKYDGLKSNEKLFPPGETRLICIWNLWVPYVCSDRRRIELGKSFQAKFSQGILCGSYGEAKGFSCLLLCVRKDLEFKVSLKKTYVRILQAHNMNFFLVVRFLNTTQNFEACHGEFFLLLFLWVEDAIVIWSTVLWCLWAGHVRHRIC